MSTQSRPSILFTHRTPQQGFRLLELTPELAELLESDGAPTLELKSPAPSTTNSRTNRANATTSEYVNLCTPTQTYSIRQVQSSNSLHVLRPSKGVGVKTKDLRIVAGAETDAGGANGGNKEGEGENGGENEDVDMEDAGNDLNLNLNIDGTVTSIAKCGSTLELHQPAEGFSAVPFLKALTGVYNRFRWEDEYGAGAGAGNEGRDDDAIVGAEASKTRKDTLTQIFSDVPVSRAQCERDLVKMCAFITRDTNKSTACWRPSAEMRLDVWKRVVEGAVLQGIDMGKQFLVADLWKSVLDDEGLAPFPRDLFEAIVRRICELGEGAPRGVAVYEMKWASIDKETCVRWVGETYLEATAIGSASAIGENELLNAWKDQLPEAWRDDVSMSVLPENCYVHPEPKTICFATEADRQKVKKNLPTDTSAATAAKKTRNWHELFKNQKRQEQ